LAIKACQTVLLIRHGKIVAQGMPEEVITDGTIQKLYDIEGADYNELMGSLEFHNERKPEVFVTGGNGTGAGVYRALSRAGFGIVCGVLHSNDIDAYIGKSLNCMVIEENPFSEISEGHFMEATAVLGMVGYMIDTGFPIGKGNRRNLEIIINAAKSGKRVYSLCGEHEKTQRYGEAARNISYCSSICELVKKITEEKAGEHEHAY
jgi:iron complex transport system ATP-binding protein